LTGNDKYLSSQAVGAFHQTGVEAARARFGTIA